MMTSDETQADIAREMRTYFQTQKRNGNPEHRPWHQVLSDWADRIEAAAEREARIREDAATESAFRRGEEIHAQHCANCAAREPGNAAAMREALDALERWVRCHGESYHWSGVEIEADIVRERDEALSYARTALAAPPRNCDLFSSYADAENYWHENVECAEVNGCFDVWLFAPAEGKEASNG